MKELITRIEELAVQVAGAQLQIDKSEAESRELGRELGKARQKMMELVNERDHALARVPPESWAEQITTARLEREQMQHQIAELRTERDRIREISKSLVPKSALKQAVQEAAELHAEVAKLRAEVPQESTREGLKNAIAKLQEETKRADKNQVKADALDSIREFAETCGMMSDETVKGFIERKRVELEEVRLDFKGEESQVDTLERQANGLRAEMASLASQLVGAKAEASGIRGHANSWGCKEGETVTAFIQRLSMELAEAKTDLADTIAKTTDLGSYAMTLGRKEGEPLERFMERQALRLAALEAAITAAKCDELAKATARIKPLEALYKTLKGWQENDHIIGYGLTIDTAINKATEALSQLTA